MKSDSNLNTTSFALVAAATLFGLGFYIGREQAPAADPYPPRQPDINIHIPAGVTDLQGPLVRLSGGCEPSRVVLEGGSFKSTGPAIQVNDPTPVSVIGGRFDQ